MGGPGMGIGPEWAASELKLGADSARIHQNESFINVTQNCSVFGGDLYTSMVTFSQLNYRVNQGLQLTPKDELFILIYEMLHCQMD